MAPAGWLWLLAVQLTAAQLTSGVGKGCGAPDALSNYPATHNCMQYAGVQRCWYEYVQQPQPAVRVPLVIDLHGFGMCATSQAEMSGWRDIADTHGAVVLWVLGTLDDDGYPTWGAMGSASSESDKTPVDDVGFLRALIAQTMTTHADLIDPTRLYAAGFSTGCMMAQRFALETSELVAAVGCQSGLLLGPPELPPAAFQPMPIITVHGTADSVVTFTMDNIATWARYNSCPSGGSPTTTTHAGYIRHAYDGCASSADVVLLELPGVGHYSYDLQVVPTTQIVWAFVRRFRRGSAAGDTGVSSDVISPDGVGVSGGAPAPAPFAGLPPTPFAGLSDAPPPTPSATRPSPRFVEAAASVRCGLSSLVGAAPLETCTVLDLQGDVLASGPVLVDGSTAANETRPLSLNETLQLLAAALGSGAGGGPSAITTLLLSSSPSLGDAAITTYVAPALRTSRLVHVGLDGCNLTATGVTAVSEFLGAAGASSPLRTLSLARNEVGEAGAVALAVALSSDTAAPLRDLHLTGASVGGAGGAAIARALAAGGGSSLQRLTLDQNGLGDEGAQALARGLGVSLGGNLGGGGLAALDLSGNGIGPRGVRAIAAALARVGVTSSGASELDLSLDANDAAGVGAAALARALVSNRNLRSLSVHANAITEEGGDAIQRAMRHGRALAHLRGLHYNDMPSVLASAIEQSATRNRHAYTRGGGAPVAAAPRESKGQEDHYPSGRDTHTTPHQSH